MKSSTYRISDMSVADWILLYFVFLISSTTGMQIHLADTGQLLHPQLESTVFPLHPPGEYRVLRWSERSRRSLHHDLKSSASTVSLQLPFPDSQVDLVLQNVNLAAQDLQLSFHEFPGQQVEADDIPVDCFYAGGSSTTWAVISTCSGLMGVVERSGKSYQVEEVSQEEYQPKSRYRRGTRETLVVIYPLKTNLAHETVLPPVLPDFDGDTGFTISTEESLDTATKAHGGDVTKSHDETGTEIATTPDGRGDRVRRRTDENTSYTVELAVFMDLGLFSYVKKRYPNSNTNKKLIEIVMTLINATTSKSWDHALLLSGQDLWNVRPSKNSTVGLAYVGGMCSRSYSCTVNEATSLAAAYIIAHELGHSFNMRHDGTGKASICKKNNFIMSPVMASGATTWSSCSSNNNDENHHGKLPGKRFNADEQCHYMYGREWRHFTNSMKPFNDVCKEIWCRNGRLLKTPSAAALEGTLCGGSKVCKRGTCVKAKKKVTDDKGGSGRTSKSLKLSTEEIKNQAKKKNSKRKTSKKSKKPKTGETNNPQKQNKSQTLNSEMSQFDVPKKGGKVKKKNNKKNTMNINNENKHKSKTAITKKDVMTGIKEKNTIKKTKKTPKKIRRIETPTHIVIKERMKYVEGKGWKIKIIKIKKTRRMMEEAGNQNRSPTEAKCNNNCMTEKKKSQISKIKKKTKQNARKSTIKGPKTSKISKAFIKASDHCQPRKIKYVNGKGWWVKIPIDCIQPTAYNKLT
ncbi:A disintegrin and metalloproteinase with thrombospondin motifs 16-like 1 [Homarus americanus]|uniref:A disintegrin and metalloproteinase with thrombospondin motifs 16-like 1 n=1 Tax=Homarus americanus TaxID=6706 RepID=A0A8J5N3Z5_HOMAM|nr:A disintegrin and metalloproteinase with thrombospondin motifs 16-like 1 [Homarus americanus]